MKKFYATVIDKLVAIYRALPNHKIHSIDPKSFRHRPQSILVIANTALGDALLCTPGMQSLRNSFPETKIHALIHRNYIPLFENVDYLDSIIPYHGGYRKFWSTLAKIRQTRPDTVLIFHGNGPQDLQLAALSGARYILKHPNRSQRKHLLSCDIQRTNQHTIENKLHLVRAIGGKQLIRTMAIAPLDNHELEQRFAAFQGAVGLQLGAADRYKMWPVERFAELAKRLFDEHPTRQIVLTGIKEERPLAGKFLQLCPDKRVVNLCGQTSIQELPYLLKQFACLVTNDTGTMHLAVALRLPVLALFSATRSEKIGPYQDRELHKVIQKNGSDIHALPKKERDDRAMRLIEVDEVYQALVLLLNSNQKK